MYLHFQVPFDTPGTGREFFLSKFRGPQNFYDLVSILFYEAASAVTLRFPVHSKTRKYLFLIRPPLPDRKNLLFRFARAIWRLVYNQCRIAESFNELNEILNSLFEVQLLRASRQRSLEFRRYFKTFDII